MAITLQTIESLPLVEEVNENTSLVGWDGEKTVRVANDMVGGSGLPEGGEPYKQLVTDGEGKTVWENKLGYKEESLKPFIPEQELGFQNFESIYVTSAPQKITDSELNDISNKMVRVYWDGVEYNCTLVMSVPGVAEIPPYIGNLHISDPSFDNTKEPFLIMIINNEVQIGTFDSATTHKVGIFYDFVVYHPIPAEYIPRIIFTRDGGDYACNFSYEEFEANVMKGLPMFYKQGNSISTNVSVYKNSSEES